jgi:hypothetical protein
MALSLDRIFAKDLNRPVYAVVRFLGPAYSPAFVGPGGNSTSI